jgi:hypothetical protein
MPKSSRFAKVCKVAIPRRNNELVLRNTNKQNIALSLAGGLIRYALAMAVLPPLTHWCDGVVHLEVIKLEEFEMIFISKASAAHSLVC